MTLREDLFLLSPISATKKKPEISNEGLKEGRDYILKVAAAQIHPFFGEPEKNRHLLSRYCAKAGQHEIDLLVFPELCVSG